jgi:coenzyme F420-0:L-glutamate ligase / coenzyme F420-1:gamma-L-glutamate ligase
MHTSQYTVFGLEPFPLVRPGDNLAALISSALREHALQDHDIVVIASKVVSIEEGRHVQLDGITPSSEAKHLSQQTGKDPRVIELVLQESTSYRLATERGPIIAMHRLGFELTSAGVDKDTDHTAYLLPEEPDASARRLRDELRRLSGIDIAVIIADSDGRADRRGAIVLTVGAAGIAPLRLTPKPGTTKQQDETIVDMLAGAAGVILGQRGRGVPVVVLRGVQYEQSDVGMRSILHQQTARR